MGKKSQRVVIRPGEVEDEEAVDDEDADLEMEALNDLEAERQAEEMEEGGESI